MRVADEDEVDRGQARRRIIAVEGIALLLVRITQPTRQSEPLDRMDVDRAERGIGIQRVAIVAEEIERVGEALSLDARRIGALGIDVEAPERQIDEPVPELADEPHLLARLLAGDRLAHLLDRHGEQALAEHAISVAIGADRGQADMIGNVPIDVERSAIGLEAAVGRIAEAGAGIAVARIAAVAIGRDEAVRDRGLLLRRRDVEAVIGGAEAAQPARQAVVVGTILPGARGAARHAALRIVEAQAGLEDRLGRALVILVRIIGLEQHLDVRRRIPQQ